MKTAAIIIGIFFACTITAASASAQEQEIEQLLLDVQKLTQLKSILSDMEKGYQIVSGGYNTIRDLSQGNFTIHKAFLDGLMAVSPSVAKYKKIADIVNNQLLLVREYKAAYSRFKQDAHFSAGELGYISGVYANLVTQSINNLNALADVITAGKLRMSDDERLKAIDHISDHMEDELMFLRQFNNNTTMLALQRAKEQNDVNTVRNIYGVNN